MNKYYILGLWIGDRYMRGGSVGLTNTEKTLIKVFKNFLKKITKAEIKERLINNGRAKQVYVNSTKLLKFLTQEAKNIENIIKTEDQFIDYISGKIDADGTIMIYNLKWRTGLIKITYGDKEEMERDLKLCEKFGFKCCILKYKNRNAWDLKFTFISSLQLVKKLRLLHPEKRKKIQILKRLIGRDSSYREACR